MKTLLRLSSHAAINAFSCRTAPTAQAVLGSLLIVGVLSVSPWTARAQGAATLTTLAENTPTSGEGFYTSLVQGSDGNFYGTAPVGGVNTDSHGTVFKITPAGVVTNLHNFSGPDGLLPAAGLVQGTDGNFYGTTTQGGTTYVDGNTPGNGTVFRITPAGVLTTLHSFTGYPADGQDPLGTLIQGSDGNFYGTTAGGGTVEGGTVFRMTPAGGLTILCSLGNGYDGAQPYAGVIQGSDGNFYGTTRLGGNGAGTVFQVTPAGAYTTLYSFAYLGTTAGSDPIASLVQGSDGNFYGTTETNGVDGAGTVFRITPAGAFTSLYSFTGNNQTLDGALIQAKDGNFYGTTYYGGAHSVGEVFQLTPAGVVTTVYSFGDLPTDGVGPAAALVQGSDGNFYGTTQTGGSGNDGTIFELTLAGMTATSPAFFTGETALANGVYYLAFPNGNYFGYYSFLTNPAYIYHFDLGYEYVFDAADGHSGVYFYDFASSDFFYTSPSFPFPYLYDFNLNSVVYYYPDPNSAGHYNTNGVRYFYVFSTGAIISK